MSGFGAGWWHGKRSAGFGAGASTFSPQSLFTANEQGAVYDPSDFSSMYQDSSGATPVTAAGQNVGLILDKRFGLRRDPELLSDPDLNTPASWSVTGTDGTHVVTISGGTLRFQSGTIASLAVAPSPALTIPANSGLYEITVVVSSWTSGSIKTNSFIETSPVLASGAGTFRRMCMAKATDTAFSFVASTTNVDMTIASISIRAVPGWHAWNNTVAGQPILTLDASNSYYLAGDGVDDGLTSPLVPTSGLNFPLAIGVAAQASGNVLAGMFGLRGGSPPYYEIQKTTGIGQWRGFLRGMTADANNVETVGTNSTPHVGLAEYTSTTVNLRMDATDSAAASTHANAFGSVSEVRIFRGSAGFFAGRFYGGVIRFGTLTETQRSNLERWLAYRAGRTL